MGYAGGLLIARPGTPTGWTIPMGLRRGERTAADAETECGTGVDPSRVSFSGEASAGAGSGN
jgi:hypothetical protein